MRDEISGEEIILRRYEKSFAPLLFEAATESRDQGEFTRWMPWCHENYAIEESLEFIEKAEENWHNETEFGYAIFDAETGEFLGGTGLNRPNEIHKIYNLGYWVRASCHKRGIAGRAARLLAEAAFEDLSDLNRIEIIVPIENIPSQKAAEKSGAVREGILRNRLMIGGIVHDAVMFSFVREDFQSQIKMTDARELFGDIDIYLFDQILKNRFSKGMKILDAGCGGGRNLVYFLRNGFDCFGIDQNAGAVESVRKLAQTLAPELAPENFRVSKIEEMPFADKSFDAVVSSAVLHFASGEKQFDRMLREMWRVLRPGGLFFARLASTIGIEDKIQKISERRYLLPDGSERFLVDEKMLVSLTGNLGAAFVEPVKTTNVQNLRSMTTWVIRKNGFI